MKYVLQFMIAAILPANFCFAAQSNEEIINHKLSNGLQVLIFEKHSMPVVSVQVWYHVGSVDEPNGLKGIAHLFEHMMFRGSRNYGPEEHFKLIKAAGGECNAYTSDETTVYYERLPADKLDLALNLEADRMGWLKLDQQVLDTERQVVMEEYRMRIDNDPIGSITQDIRGFLFPNSPFEYGPIGKMADIRNFTVTECQDFYNKYYAPNNATLVITGSVDADKTIKMVEEKFGDLKPSELIPKAKFEVAHNIVKKINKGRTDFPIPVTILSFYTDGARDKDRAALSVLLNSLAEGRSSRLWKSLVIDKKIAEYFLGANIEASENGVVFLAAAHLPGLSKKVERDIWKHVEQIKTKGLNEDEFTKSRNQVKAANLFEKYYVNALASDIGYCEVVRGDYELFYKQDQEIENVTQEDVIRAANRYLTKENVKKLYFEPREGIFLAGVAGFLKSIF
ncbi:MAG: pitrilysin family protein [Phycisphaerales bacterium]